MELFIIRGRQNDGKTTTATMLHNALVRQSTAVRLVKTNGDYLPVWDEVCDFRSIIDLGETRVAIISAGDDDDTVDTEMNELIYEYRPDVLVVCARAYDRDGSTYRMLKESYSDIMKPENEFWIEYVEDQDKAMEIKQGNVEKIVNTILNK